MPKDDVLFVIDSQSSTRNSAGAFVISAGGSGGGGISNTELANYLRRDGSSAMTGNLDMGNFSIVNVALVDGNDISAHVANPDAHHNRQHQFDSIDHQGLLPWDKIDFAGSDLYDVANRPHVALTGIGPNDHHNQVHNILGADHTVTGVAFDVIGIPTTNNVLGLITPSSNPGATQRLLRTDSFGELVIKKLNGTDYVKSAAYIQAATYVQAGSYVSAVTYVDSPILQQAGNIAINSGINIYLNPTGYIAVALSKSIRTDSFVSGFAGSGWQIDQNISAPGTNAEFDNLTIRGRMRVYELIIQQIRATNGSIFVSSVSKAKTVTLVGVDTYTITSDEYHGFLVNDLIRAQRFTKGNVTTTPSEGMTGQIYRCDMRVTAVTDLYTYTAIRENGSDIPKKDYDFVRIGNTTDVTRQGSLYLSSDDSNAPFIDIVNDVSSWVAWTGAAKTKVRIGKITGVTSVANEYGIIASNTGFGSTDSYFKASNLGIILNNVPLQFFNGVNQTGYWSPNGNSFWIGTNTTDRRIEWNGTTGVLTVKGEITIVGSGGNAATTTSVANAQATAISYTQAYAPDKLLSNTAVNWALGDTLGGNAYDTARVNGAAASIVKQGAERANAGLSSIGQVVLPVQSPLISAFVPPAIGLNLTSQYLGYYNGTSFTNFIKSDGTFRFGSAMSGNRIEWNGNDLAGYNNVGTLQWYASASNGYIYAGGGYVQIGDFGIVAGTYTSMNASGINVQALFYNGFITSASIPTERAFTLTNDFGSVSTLFGGTYAVVSPTNYRAGVAYMQAFRYSSSNVLLDSFALKVDAWAGDLYFSLNATNWKVWHAGNDGSGTGLDADLLDGINSTSFARNDIGQTFFGNQIISGVLEVTSYIQADRSVDFTRQSVTPAAVATTVRMYQGGDGNMYFRGPNGYARITGITVLSGSFP